MRPIIALDLGTKTGWATRDHLGYRRSGTWVLATQKRLKADRQERHDRTRDCRFCGLYDRLQALIHATDDFRYHGLLGFEDVQFSVSTAQTQLWSSLRAAVWAVGCAWPEIRIEAVPVGTLKKFATGSGNATKEQMALAAQKGFPLPAIDDNEVDARHLLNYLEQIA